MNSTDLKDHVYKESAKVFSPPLTRLDVAMLVDMMVEGMKKGLVESDEEGDRKVLLRGFGTLKVVKRKGRTYSVRGKDVTVGDRDTVTFKPGATLFRAISKEVEATD